MELEIEKDALATLLQFVERLVSQRINELERILTRRQVQRDDNPLLHRVSHQASKAPTS
jgi:hypothetical protein